jgi:hypothetical protein
MINVDKVKDKKIIYAAAQYFGFGPTSNLFTILRALKENENNIEVRLIENEGSKFFMDKNPGVADMLVDRINLQDADLLFSSFDPFPIVEAWAHEVKTIFYCNLFWFWDVFKTPDKILAHKKELEMLKASDPIKAIEKFKLIFKNNPHEGIFLGYFIADHAFTRKFPNMDHYLNIFEKNQKIIKSEILIPEINLKNILYDDLIFIQLSGSKSPVVTLEENKLYFELIIKFSIALAILLPEKKFLICANPHVIDLVEKQNNLPGNLKISPSISQIKNIELMKQSLAMLTSPGMETIYEAAYADCPVFLLPEQSAGQYPIVQMLHSSGFYPDGFLINDNFKERKKLEGEEDAHEIYKCIKKMYELDNAQYLKMVMQAKQFIEQVSSQHHRQIHVNNSMKAIESYMGEDPFGSAKKISTFIKQILEIA